jgi:hypothetical protein
MYQARRRNTFLSAFLSARRYMVLWTMSECIQNVANVAILSQRRSSGPGCLPPVQRLSADSSVRHISHQPPPSHYFDCALGLVFGLASWILRWWSPGMSWSISSIGPKSKFQEDPLARARVDSTYHRCILAVDNQVAQERTGSPQIHDRRFRNRRSEHARAVAV